MINNPAPLALLRALVTAHHPRRPFLIRVELTDAYGAHWDTVWMDLTVYHRLYTGHAGFVMHPDWQWVTW